MSQSPNTVNEAADLREELRAIRERLAALKQSEQTLAVVTARSNAVLAAAVDGILTIDETGTIESVNAAACRLFGYSREEILGRNVRMLMPTPFREEHDNYLANYRKTGEKKIIGIGREVVGRRRDGSTFPMDLSVGEAEASDRKIFSGIVRDITERKTAERTLRESEERYRDLVASSVDLVCKISPRGRFLFVGENAAAVLGHPADALLGIEPLSLVHADDLSAATESFAGVREKGSCCCGPFRFRDGDNQWRWMEISARATDTSVATVWRDVGDRVEARHRAVALEFALLESERRARAIFDQTYQFNGLMDTNGWLIEASQTALTFGGLRRDDVIGRPIWEARWFAHEPTGAHRLRDAVTTAANGEVVRYETEIQGVGDTTTTIDFSIRPLRNANGDVDLLLSEGRDISDLKRAEEEVRAERDFVSTILGTAEVLVMVLDNDGRITRVNRHLEEATGFRAQQLLNQEAIPLLFPKPPRERDEAGLRDTLTEPLGPFINSLATSSGEERRVQWSATPIHDAKGQPTGVLNVGLDITDLTSLQENFNQVQKMEAIGTLAGGVAHDFNNLLSAIGGSSELILRKVEPGSRLARSAERILKATHRGEALTKQLLAFSRKQVTRPEVILLNEAASAARELFERMIGEDIQVEVDLDELAGRILFDPSQFDQVVINLVANARDAMPNGGTLKIGTSATTVEYDSAAEPGLAPGAYSKLTISDTGTGIAREILDRIFDPFFTTKPKGQGTGLGLSTVKGILEENDAAISVESEVGVGTTFSIYIPRASAKEIATNGKAATHQATDRTEHATILVVEDDELVRDLLQETLEEAGHSVLIAESPSAAQAYPDRGIDLLITDVVMPESSGFTLANQMSARVPQLRVLYMSGYTDGALADRGQLTDDDAFIRKPFSNKQLLEKVREVLGGC